jgi:hypothetical protein
MAKTEVVESFGDMESKFLALVTDPEVTDPSAISRQIVERILGAGTVDEILGMGDSAGLNAEAVGERSFYTTEPPVWLRSSKGKPGETLGVFAVLRVRFVDDKTENVVTCGGQNVLGQLYALQAKGALDRDFGPVRFTTKPTAAGYEVLWLTKGDEAPKAKA